MADFGLERLAGFRVDRVAAFDRNHWLGLDRNGWWYWAGIRKLTETHLAEMFGSAYSPAALCEMVAGWLLSHLEVFDEPLAAYFKP